MRFEASEFEFELLEDISGFRLERSWSRAMGKRSFKRPVMGLFAKRAGGTNK